MKRKKRTPFGDTIFRRRRQLELTQSDVAAKTGCRPNYIGYLESAARLPSPKLTKRLAKALDLDPQEL